MHPIQLTLGHAKLSQSITDPASPITKPNTDSRWVFLLRLTVLHLRSTHLTSPPTHTPLIHTQVRSTSPQTQICQNPQPILPTHLPDPILAFYIYIYINIYIFIYFFYLFIFLIIHFLFKLCIIHGLCIWNFGAWLVFALIFFRILELDWLFMIGFCCNFFLNLASWVMRRTFVVIYIYIYIFFFLIWLVGLCVEILELDPCFYSVILFKIPLLL